LKQDESPYLKFSLYYNIAKTIKVNSIKKNKFGNFINRNKKFKNEFLGNIDKFYVTKSNILVNGGRSNALKILKNVKDFKNYNQTHDYPLYETTHLSPYLKFNVVSIREVYFALKKKTKIR